MAENSVEERMLELIEEICDDEIIREERDVDLFEEGLLDSMAAIELLVANQTEGWRRPLRLQRWSARK